MSFGENLESLIQQEEYDRKMVRDSTEEDLAQYRHRLDRVLIRFTYIP